MPNQINLLPQDKGPSVGALRAVAKIRSVAILWFALLVVVGGSSLAYLIYSQRQVSDLESNVAQLKTSITSLQASEQRLVLVKDRIAKVKPILADMAFKRNLDRFQALLFKLPQDISVSDEQIDSSLNTLTFVTSSSSSFSTLLSLLKDSSEYKDIFLSKVDFQTTTGEYKAVLMLK